MNATAPAGKKVLLANLGLLLFVTVLFHLNFYQKTMFFRPTSYHQWRQTDCLSIAKNYYEEGMNFFQPALHYQGVEGGKAVSECPILNYTAAALWKVFGEHEFIYRLLEYVIFLCAVFLLFNTLLRFTGSAWLSFFAASLLLTSPLLAYYSLNFIADVPALSMAIISFCFLYRFSREGGTTFFYAALVTGALGVLMKASALVPFGLTLLTGISSSVSSPRFNLAANKFRNRWVPLVAMVVVAALVVGWYKYAVYYNNYHKNLIFLLTVLPIWDMEESQVLYNLKMLFNNLFPLFLSRPMLFLMLCTGVYVLVNLRWLEPLLKWAFCVSLGYFIFYLLFFFQVFGVHDYYLVNLFIFPVITIFCASLILVRRGFLQGNLTFLRWFVILVTLFGSFHAAAVYRLRTVEDDKLVYWFPFISEDEAGLAKYLFWRYGNDVKRIEQITPVLRAAGIERTDKVLSIPDFSFDVSLYLMDQKGYTVAREHITTDTTVVERFADRVKYVVLSDTNLKKERAFVKASRHFTPYFKHGPVEVFRVRKVD